MTARDWAANLAGSSTHASMRRGELLEQTETWAVCDLDLEPSLIEVGERSLGITICQVPVVVSVGPDAPHVEVFFADRSTERIPASQ